MKLRFGGVLVALLFACTSAWAAKPPLEEARALTRKATVEYDVGHFDQALDLYTKAYELYPKPALLFDIAQCHRLLGHYERALFFFHGYLREEPDAPNRAQAEKLLQDTQEKYDAERAAQTESHASETPAPSSSPPPPTPNAAPSSERAPSSGEGSSSAGGHLSPTFQVVGLVTAGAGAVLVGVGVYEGLHSQSLSQKIAQLSAQHGTWTAQYQSDYSAGKSAAALADVFYVAGGVALATGVVLAWLGWPSGAPTTTAAVTPMPGGASVGITGRF
jgi:tetratricopeptide (TPR) repeat protein